MRQLGLIAIIFIGAAWTEGLTRKPAVDLLSKAFVAKTFDVKVEEIFSNSLNRETVLFSWPKPNAEAIRKRNKEILAKRGNVRVPPKDGEKPEVLIRDRAIVHLSYSVQESAEIAERIIQEAFSKDSEILGKVNHGRVEKYRVNYDIPLKDLGDHAAWSTSHRQLTLRQGAVIFHLNVDVAESPEPDGAQAKIIMAEVLDNLQ